MTKKQKKTKNDVYSYINYDERVHFIKDVPSAMKVQVRTAKLMKELGCWIRWKLIFCILTQERIQNFWCDKNENVVNGI